MAAACRRLDDRLQHGLAPIIFQYCHTESDSELGVIAKELVPILLERILPACFPPKGEATSSIIAKVGCNSSA